MITYIIIVRKAEELLPAMDTVRSVLSWHLGCLGCEDVENWQIWVNYLGEWDFMMFFFWDDVRIHPMEPVFTTYRWVLLMGW